MPNKDDLDRRFTVQQTICNYFRCGLRGLKDDVGFGFKTMELRDITSFVLNDLNEFKQEVWWDSNYEENLIKLMIIFYLMYNQKYYCDINEIIYTELAVVQSYPYKFKNEKIDIPCEIDEEHKNIIESFKKVQSAEELDTLIRIIGDID